MNESQPAHGASEAAGRHSRRTVLRTALLGGGALGAATVLGACGESKPKQAAAAAMQTNGNGLGKGLTIRFFGGGDPGDAFGSIVVNGAKAATKTFGTTTDIVFSGWDVNKMQDQLREAIAAKPDAIAMMGHAGDDALMPLAAQAHKAGITMMWQNVDVPRVRARFGGGFIGADLVQQGHNLAAAALKQLGLGSGDDAIVFGAWGQPGRQIREQAVADTFAKAGLRVQKIVAPPAASSDPNSLTPLVNSSFRRRPDTKVIVLPGGQLLGAAPQYLQAIGKQPGEVKIVGFDLSTDVVQAMKDGAVQLTADQEPYLQGFLPIESLVFALRYGLAPFSVDTSAGLVTRQQAARVANLVRQGIR